MTPAPQQATLRGVRVLGVDDNATNRAVLVAQLRAWGMHVDCVADGDQALEYIRMANHQGQPYALGLLDYQMPGMDGLTLGRIIKADRALADLHLVLLTSFGQRGHGQAARQAGFAGYLVKPIRQSQLYDCLVTVMGMPTAPTPPKLITRHNMAEVQTQAGIRVLVAEDNIVNQQVAVRMLEKLGCRVDVVANGCEALKVLAQCPYDLVLMDCQMPDMDGYATTAAIRAREQQTGQHLPNIAMTANAMRGDREDCLQAGMDDYVSKPVQPAQLLTMLRKWGSH